MIFQKAVQKFGSKLSHRQLDFVIRKSEFGPQVDRWSRARLKSMLYNYERTNFDAKKAIQLEIVKMELCRLASDHYRQTIMAKAMFSLMKRVIDERNKHPASYLCSTSSEVNTTLQRLLEGVLLESKESQLNEFIQIERTIETEMSETLNSEPTVLSN